MANCLDSPVRETTEKLTHRKAKGCNELSKNHNRKKKGLFL